VASSFSLFARPDASSSSDARTTADYRERAEAVLETKVPTRKRRSVPTSVSPSGLCDHPPVRKVWPCGLASTDKVGMMNGKATLTSCAALLILLAGCSDGTGPVQSSKLLVTNTSCAAGPCLTFEVLAFPENQPMTPGGLWSLDLGGVAGASACLTIPASAAFTITDAGSGARTVVRWTTEHPVSIGFVTSSQSRLQASPSTGTFVAAHAAAWSVALPGNTAPVPGRECQ